MTEKSKEERWDMVERRREKFGTRERLLWKSCEKECESDLAEKLDFRSQRNSVGTGDLGSIDLSLPSREMAPSTLESVSTVHTAFVLKSQYLTFCFFVTFFLIFTASRIQKPSKPKLKQL